MVAHLTGSRLVRYLAFLVAALAAWAAVYWSLEPFSRWFAFHLLGLDESSRLGSAVQFFIYDTPKVLLLLVLIVFFVGIIRTFFTPQTTRRILAGKRESAGNVLAAMLGIVTPFCSCSAVPLFIGFVTAGVPLGVTFSFLIAAPMVNEVALVLLYGLFGWQVAALYLITGLVIAMLAGWVIGRLKLERHVEAWVYETRMGEGSRSGWIGRPACRPGGRPSKTSWARCGRISWAASPSERPSTVMFLRTSWLP